MRDMLGFIVRGIALLVALVTAMIFMVLRFQNPDMTETRLFLEYWPVMVPLIIVACVAFVVSTVLDAKD